MTDETNTSETTNQEFTETKPTDTTTPVVLPNTVKKLSAKRINAKIAKVRGKRADDLNSVFRLDYLSAKEKTKYAKRVREKLGQLGVKDGITWERTQKIVHSYEPAEEEYTTESGEKAKRSTMKNVPYVRVMARNMSKNLVEKFLEMSKQEIDQFLDTDPEEFKKAMAAKTGKVGVKSETPQTPEVVEVSDVD